MDFSKLVRLGQVDSTNRYAASAALAGAEEGLVVVADEQTAGRGRLGRSWYAQPGEALLCSVLLRPPLAREDLHLAVAAVSLAACQAASRLGGIPVGLKWPNDLVVGERKLGGVLAEFVAPGGANPTEAVVVGVGINLVVSATLAEKVRAASDEAGGIAGLAESGRLVGGEELLAAFLARLAGRYPRLGRTGDRTMEEYRAACTTLGRWVRVETPERQVRGRAVAVADDGRLVVEVDGSTERFAAADVVHLRDEPHAAGGNA